jgi:hypothetical protein
MILFLRMMHSGLRCMAGAALLRELLGDIDDLTVGGLKRSSKLLFGHAERP